MSISLFCTARTKGMQRLTPYSGPQWWVIIFCYVWSKFKLVIHEDVLKEMPVINWPFTNASSCSIGDNVS